MGWTLRIAPKKNGSNHTDQMAQNLNGKINGMKLQFRLFILNEMASHYLGAFNASNFIQKQSLVENYFFWRGIKSDPKYFFSCLRWVDTVWKLIKSPSAKYCIIHVMIVNESFKYVCRGE